MATEPTAAQRMASLVKKAHSGRGGYAVLEAQEFDWIIDRWREQAAEIERLKADLDAERLTLRVAKLQLQANASAKAEREREWDRLVKLMRAEDRG